MKMLNNLCTNTTSLVLCNTACCSSWLFSGLAVIVGLHFPVLKLTVKCVNAEQLNDT